MKKTFYRTLPAVLVCSALAFFGGVATLRANAATSPRHSVDMTEDAYYAVDFNEEVFDATVYQYHNVTFANEDDPISGYENAITVGSDGESGFVIWQLTIPQDACYVNVNACLVGTGHVSVSPTDSTYANIIEVNSTEPALYCGEAMKAAYGNNSTQTTQVYVQIDGEGISVLGKLTFSHYGTVTKDGEELRNDLQASTYLDVEENVASEPIASQGFNVSNKKLQVGSVPTTSLAVGETTEYAVYAFPYTKAADTAGFLLKAYTYGPYRLSIYTGEGAPNNYATAEKWTDIKCGHYSLGGAWATINVTPFCVGTNGTLYVRFARATDSSNNNDKSAILRNLSLMTCKENTAPATGTTIDMTQKQFYLAKLYSSDSTTVSTYREDTDMYYAFGEYIAWGVNSTYTQSVYLRGGYLVYRVHIPTTISKFYVSGAFAGPARVSASFDGKNYDTVFDLISRSNNNSSFNVFDHISSSSFDGYVYVKVSGNDARIHNILEFTYEGASVGANVSLDGSRYYFTYSNGFTVSADSNSTAPAGEELDYFVTQKALRCSSAHARYNDGAFTAAINAVPGNYTVYKFPIVEGSERLLFEVRLGGQFHLMVLRDSSTVSDETDWATYEGWDTFACGYYRQGANNYTFDLSQYLEHNSEYLYIRVSDATHGDGYGGALYNASLVSYTEYKNGTGKVYADDQQVVEGVSIDLSNIASAEEDVETQPVMTHTFTFRLISSPAGSNPTLTNEGVFTPDMAGDYVLEIGAISPAGSTITPKQITVTAIAIPNVIISDTALSLVIGNTYTLTASCALEGSNILWKTENSRIVNVTSKGVLTARSEGTAVVTAYILVNGKEVAATCTVTVTTEENAEKNAERSGCNSSLSASVFGLMSLCAAGAFVFRKKK